MIQRTKKVLLISAGYLSLLCGVIGAFLPIIPTTPFLILAAFFFSKGSTRMHQWLLSLPRFGPMIREWEEHGVIRVKAKVLSTLVIIPLFIFTLFFVETFWWVKVIVCLIGISVLSFIWTRPSKILLKVRTEDADSKETSAP